MHLALIQQLWTLTGKRGAAFVCDKKKISRAADVTFWNNLSFPIMQEVSWPYQFAVASWKLPKTKTHWSLNGRDTQVFKVLKITVTFLFLIFLKPWQLRSPNALVFTLIWLKRSCNLVTFIMPGKKYTSNVARRGWNVSYSRKSKSELADDHSAYSN